MKRKFTIEIDKTELGKEDFLGDMSIVRARIRVKVGKIDITSKDGRYQVSDYIPYNCTKMLSAVQDILQEQPHMVRFTDTDCDIHFTPRSSDTVLVKATRSNGDALNPAVPQEGLPVATDAVVSESIRYSEAVAEMYAPHHNRVTDCEYYQDFREQLSAIKDQTA